MRRITLFAWGVLGYNLLVILWGAYVRATGSGAGCGAHWPTCDGQVIPRIETQAMAIEFTHRIMSGLSLLLVIVLAILIFRSHPRGHIVRTGATLALIFTLTEALVGAGLVLFELVGANDSVARAAIIAIHLTNTFLLLAGLTLTAWWTSGRQPMAGSKDRSFQAWLGVGWVVLIILGASGAITALGDTLFPVGSLREGIQQDFSPTAHFLIRLRIYHPILAVSAGLYVTFVAWLSIQRTGREIVKWIGYTLAGLFGVQLVLGLINILLLAPVWMQMVHLLFADLVWIGLVLLTAASLEQIVVPLELPKAPNLQKI